MKAFAVIVTLYDLPAAHAEQRARVEASSLKVAASRALAEVLKREHVKRKRIRNVRIHINEVIK